MRRVAVAAATIALALASLTACVGGEQGQANDAAAEAVDAVLASLVEGDGAGVAEVLELDISSTDAARLDETVEHVSSVETDEVTGPAIGADPWGPRSVTVTWELAGEEQSAQFRVVGVEGEEDVQVMDPFMADLAVPEDSPGLAIGVDRARGDVQLLPAVYAVEPWVRP